MTVMRWDKLSAFDMPEFREPSGAIWVWDSESKSYVRKDESELEHADRGHATGGDNDLFDTARQTEEAGSPETEGWAGGITNNRSLYHSALRGHDKIEPCDQCGKPVRVDVPHWRIDVEGQGSYAIGSECRKLFPEAKKVELSEEGFDPTSEEHTASALNIDAKTVVCPNCQDETEEHICPQCGKDLTPEWNREADDAQDWLEAQAPHSEASEFYSLPERSPKRNRQKTDDSYPTMISKVAGKLEIGRWLQDRMGQLHYQHGNGSHEQLAQQAGLSYPQDVGAVGVIYNDGIAEIQEIYPGWDWDERSTQHQLEQAFGPVRLVSDYNKTETGSHLKNDSYSEDNLRSFAHYHEELAWKMANEPNLDECPECGDPMFDKSGDKVCGGCGHRQPIIHTQAAIKESVPSVPAPAQQNPDPFAEGSPQMQEMQEAGVMPGASAAARYLLPLAKRYAPQFVKGTAGKVKGLFGGAGNLMKRALLIHGGMDVAQNTGIIPGQGGLLGGGMAGGGSAPAAGQMMATPGMQGLISKTFGEEEVGRGTKNRGEDSDPEHDGSGANFEEKGDSPELLKDVDGEGNAKSDPTGMSDDADEFADFDVEGFLAFLSDDQRKALHAFEMNQPLIMEFAEDPEKDGSSHPIIKAIDDLLEAAFPGYKDEIGEDGFGESLEKLDEVMSEQNPDAEAHKKREAAQGIQPHPGLEFMSPDDVAETVDGISQSTAMHLWDILMKLEEEGKQAPTGGEGHDPYGEHGYPTVETPYDRRDMLSAGHGNMFSIWNQLSPEEQQEINAAMEAGDADYESRWGPVFGHRSAMWHEAFDSGLSADPLGQQVGQVPNVSGTCQICGQSHLPGTPCPSTELMEQRNQPMMAIPMQQPNTQPKVVTKTADLFEQDETWNRGSEDFDDYDAPLNPECPMCGGPGLHLGDLGSRSHFRCRDCGMDFSESGHRGPIPESHDDYPDNDLGDEGEYRWPGTMASVQDDEHMFIRSADTLGDSSNIERKPERHMRRHNEQGLEHEEEDDHSVWEDESGKPLQEGMDYEMNSTGYAIPDKITIDRILPDKLVFTIHSGDVDYQDEITKLDMETNGYTFSSADEVGPDSELGLDMQEDPIRPGHDPIPQETDLSHPATVVSADKTAMPFSPTNPDGNYTCQNCGGLMKLQKKKLGRGEAYVCEGCGNTEPGRKFASEESEGLEDYTGSFRGDSPEARAWLNEGSGVDVDPELMAKLAGKDFTPREQRTFIDESGNARNLDKLDLEGTHYTVDEMDNEFGLY